MHRVVVAGGVHRAAVEHLRARDDVDAVLLDTIDPGALNAELPDADGVLLRTQPITREVLALAPNLKVVSRHGVGYDAVDVDALSERRIPLTVVGDVNSISVAEHALFLILSAAKQAIAYDRAVRSDGWSIRDGYSAQEIAGKMLLVVGFGRIGRRVARLAQAFEAMVMVHDPFVGDADIRAEGAEPIRELDEGLARADVVTLHVPFTKGGPLLGADQIARMKPGAVLVNTARGGHVDEAALVAALKSGHLAGAGLDVFAQEPPAPDSPLFDLDSVVLSPHSAGLSEQCAARMGLVAARNITDAFDGTLDPALVVNRDALGL